MLGSVGYVPIRTQWGSSPRRAWWVEGSRSPQRRPITLSSLEVPQGSWPMSWIWTWGTGAQSRKPGHCTPASRDGGTEPGAARGISVPASPLVSPTVPTALFEEVFSDPALSPSACMPEAPRKKVGFCPQAHPSFPHTALTYLVRSSISSTFELPPTLPPTCPATRASRLSRDAGCLCPHLPTLWSLTAGCQAPHSVLGTWDELGTENKSLKLPGAHKRPL